MNIFTKIEAFPSELIALNEKSDPSYRKFMTYNKNV